MAFYKLQMEKGSMAVKDTKTEAYLHLNRHWKSVCKLLLGGEVGELSQYSSWLYEENGPRLIKKSDISGKEVVYASKNYSGKSKWASFDEVDMDKKYPPLSINEIKDIDSLFEAVSERAVYAGNMVLGNSKFVEASTTITDCFYVLGSERTAYTKYAAYSTRGGYSDYVFGCYGFGPVHFCIRAKGGWEITRCFSTTKVDFSNDCYYSHGLSNCSDCMFCFNLKNQKTSIGNLQLAKEKYLQLKKKLISEMRGQLIKDKRLPSLAGLVSLSKPDYSELKKAMKKPGFGAWKQENKDKTRIENAFSRTTKLLFGKSHGPIDKYSKWLEKNSTITLKKAKSCASGVPLILPDYASFIKYPEDRLLSQDEADFVGEHLSISEQDAAELSMKNTQDKLSKIAFFSPSWLSGKLKNNIDSPLCIDAVDCYHGILYLKSELCAFCFCPRSCDYSFGCKEGRHTSFCINSHFSTKIMRCFEVDSSNNCTDCYFCHNVENLQNCMFCFNTKNKSYAIGNVVVGREKYLQAKKILLDWINSRLEKENGLGIDIYSIAEKKKEK